MALNSNNCPIVKPLTQALQLGELERVEELCQDWYGAIRLHKTSRSFFLDIQVNVEKSWRNIQVSPHEPAEAVDGMIVSHSVYVRFDDSAEAIPLVWRPGVLFLQFFARLDSPNLGFFFLLRLEINCLWRGRLFLRLFVPAEFIAHLCKTIIIFDHF